MRKNRLTQRQRVFQIIGRIAAMLVLGLLIGAYFCRECLSNPIELVWNIGYSASLGLSIWFANGWINDFLDGRISWLDEPRKRAFVGIVATIVVTCVVVFSVSAVFFLLFAKYDWGIFKEVIGGTLVIALVITAAISSFLHGREFLLLWRESVVQAEALKREQAENQYRGLRAQLNPHFLFNSLNTLSSLVQYDADKAQHFIEQLAEVYRYVLEQSEQELVSLKDELDFVDAYSQLLAIRHGENFRFEAEVEPDEGVYLPPLSLQLLVENAIKHNVVSSRYPLVLRLHRRGDTLVVENTLRRRNQPTHTSLGTGLANLRKRYELLGASGGVEVEETEAAFRVVLPLLALERV